eukprot:scaffold3437_cov145-Skeletonema_menzelii.AAC.21
MNPNLGLAGCDETVNDILENIPSDSERRAATDGDTRRGGGYSFRRPASFRIFRRQVDGSSSFDDDRSADNLSVDTNLRTVMMSQSAGEDPEERKITAIDQKKKEGDIYNFSADDDIDPLSNDYVVLIALAREGNDVDPRNLVIMFALANLGYVWADVASDGFMVWIAHREPIEKRGKMQTLVYSVNKLGQIVVNLLILIGFSGPEMNCPGYQPDPSIPCTNNIYIIKRVDPELYANNPYSWCYEMCKDATFEWDLSIPEFAISICFVIFASIPLYLRLKEDKVRAEPRIEFLSKFWSQLKRKAAWQVILYGMISHITFGVSNAAKMPANYVWLDLHTFQHQIMVIFEKFFFFVGLNLVRQYALNVSWRKQVLAGSLLVLFFNSLYFIIIFDVWRNSWFYIFTDVSALFMYTLNFLASHACMVEVAEPGYEAITYSLITTATNAVSPLSAVISYQLLAFFPLLNDQESIATDTPEVRSQFASLQALVMLINVSSLLSLPLLPRQKKETRELVAKGEMSKFWGSFVIFSALTFLCYSTIVTYVTVKYHDVYGCMKILGGGGCAADESSFMALGLVTCIFAYCYGVNFYLSYLPIFTGERKFSWAMFY